MELCDYSGDQVLLDRTVDKLEDGGKPDLVDKPNHYMVIGNTEAKDLIKVMLDQYVKDNPSATPYQIYCAGCSFKYRLRVGKKDAVGQEVRKALRYVDMHNEEI